MSTQVNLNSFDNIYSDTYDSVLKYVICKCSNLDDTNDIIQDIYLELYKKLQKNNQLLVNDINDFMIGIAKNKVRQYWRLKYKIKSMLAYSKDDPNIKIDQASDTNVEDIILMKDDIEKVQLFIQTKKPIVRKIFYLYYCFDMTLADISDELNMSLSTVKSKLYRLIDDLNRYFKKEEKGSE